MVVDDVMDIKDLFNPGEKKAFPVGTSRCKQTRGICTKSIQPGRDWFMSENSPLHWRIRKDINNKVIIQSQFTTDDTVWSQQHYPWTKAPRPDQRAFGPNTSGLVPSDVRMAPNNPLQKARATELKDALDAVRDRLTDMQWAEAQEMFTRVTTQRTAIRPQDHGAFHVDTLDPDDGKGDHDDDRMLYGRPECVFQSQSHQDAARKKRRVQGHASNPLVVGKFVAYTTYYEDDVKAEHRQPFWVGKISNINVTTEQVQVQCFHTKAMDNLTAKRASYVEWDGEDKTPWVDVTRVLAQFDNLTRRDRLVPAPIRRMIQRGLILYATMDRDKAASKSHVGVGLAMMENAIEDDENEDANTDDEGDGYE
jgi:hypothetical protein